MSVVSIPLKPGYAFTRSYLSRVVIDVAALIAPSFDGTAFTFQDTAHVDWYLKVRPNVWEWSSNGYTIDWLIDEAASTASIAGTPVIDGFYVDVRLQINEPLRYIWIQPGGLPGTEYPFTLPPAPPDYWLPGSHY